MQAHVIGGLRCQAIHTLQLCPTDCTNCVFSSWSCQQVLQGLFQLLAELHEGCVLHLIAEAYNSKPYLKGTYGGVVAHNQICTVCMNTE